MSQHTFDAKLRGRKGNAIQMPKKEFEEEHRRLPELLRSGTPAERSAEAARQEAEARRIAVRRGFRGNRGGEDI